MYDQTLKFAYTAGYLDGDGCFYLGTTIQKPKNTLVYEYSIQVLSVKKDVLYWFKENFGGFIREKRKITSHRIPYQWTIKGQVAAKLAACIHPYMIDKKISCEIFVKFSKIIFFNYFIKISNEILSERNELIRKIKQDKHMENFVTKEDIEISKYIEKTVHPLPKDFAYLAGLIDSEGCFRVKKWKPKNKPNDVYAISLEIGNTRLPIIPWLMERFGGNVVYFPEKPRKKAYAVWSLSSKSLSEILPKIHPFLTSKKELCEKLIEFQNTIIPNGGDRHSNLFHSLFEKTRKRRDVIIDEIHKLNAKGS